MIGQRPEEECLPTRRTTSIPSGWPPSARPAKLSSASIYSRTHFQTPSGEAVVSFICDILHSIPDTNGVLCLCECFFPCKFFESGVVLTHLKLQERGKSINICGKIFPQRELRELKLDYYLGLGFSIPSLSGPLEVILFLYTSCWLHYQL